MIVTIGRVGRAHGIRGEVAVDVRTDTPDERFAAGATLATEPPQARPLTVAGTRWHSGRLLVRFGGVDDRKAAELLRGVRLLADVGDDERPDDPEEFFDHQLVGLRVSTVDGTAVGTVLEVIHGPGHDLLAVRGDSGGEILVPFVSEIVPEVDVDAGTLVVDPPAGLLELGEGEPEREEPVRGGPEPEKIAGDPR